ncbi:MAG: KpsF/GutQ family sugar-phosphate isomerase [Verrucomicrobiales bacterium]|nr:KpsF/GutQ family sugar-phosphate isomerase [Verrucomicrobiales bacterium]
MNSLQRARTVIDIEVEALLDLKKRLRGEFRRAVGLITEAVKRHHKIIIVGVGKSGHIGDKIAATLTSTGAPAVVLNALNAMHGDLGVVAAGDVVIALSYSGETEELLRILPSIKREKVTLIAMCGNAKSTLAVNADVQLDTAVRREACPLNLAPTSSTTVMLALGDCLAMAVLDAQGFQKEDFARYHPGGSLGRNLLLKAADVMRPLTAVAALTVSDTVAAALAAMSARRCGATVVTDRRGRLAGIYTHGDFVRGYQRDKDTGSAKLGAVMTKRPVTVSADRLAVEVLRIFEEHRIKDLIVLERQNKPIGLIDVQDLTKLKLL